jgi:CubicO group peptidase (beta-lactamase class C family)
VPSGIVEAGSATDGSEGRQGIVGVTGADGDRLAATWTALDAWIERRLARERTPGLTLAITDRERTLRVATYGFADLAARAPVKPETLFQIGSIGKSFTALVLLRMRERGLVDFDAPVTTYLPWFAVRSEHAPIAIHHLLCHSAGIIGGTELAQNGRYEVWRLRETDVSGPPGAHFRYSNVGYKALGFVIQDLLGRSYGDAVGQEVLEPLGMHQTVVPITNDVRERSAVGYGPIYDDRPWHRSSPLAPLPWFETDTADGSIASAPADMAAYLRLMVNRGAYPGGRIVSEDSFALMTGAHAVRPWHDEAAAYGYGWIRSRQDGRDYEGHSGGMVGYYSSLTLDREAGLGAFVSINGPGDPYVIAKTALHLTRAALAGEDMPEPADEFDPRRIEDAAAIEGHYPGERGPLRLTRSTDNPMHLA